jgi:hypothetical protein
MKWVLFAVVLAACAVGMHATFEPTADAVTRRPRLEAAWRAPDAPLVAAWASHPECAHEYDVTSRVVASYCPE